MTDAGGAATAGRWRRAVPYAFAAAVTTALLWFGLRLDGADLNAPFDSDQDAQLIQPLVKSVVETGTHWRNDRLGAPGVQELHDFPVVDHLHLAVLWLIGQFTGWAAAFNLYHLLTYPLTAVVGVFVLRRMGLSAAAAVCGGVLYAFLPYHYLRGLEHYFLAAYWVVPLTLLVAVRVCDGRLPFFRRVEERWRFAPLAGHTLAAVLIAVATASAGAYYAFFGCAVLCAAGVYGWVAAGTWRAAAAAGLVVAVVVAAGVLNHAPAFAYQAEWGRNSVPHARIPEEADVYGLKVAHLVLPADGHNLRPLADARSAFQSPLRLCENENQTAALGTVGTAGLVAVLVGLLLRLRRMAPLAPTAALTVYALLLGTVGGLGSLFADLLSPQVRAYNRISVYIAFLALFAACWLLDRLCDRPRLRGWRWPLFLAVLAFGVWDQTGTRWFTSAPQDARRETAERFYADREFFRRIEEAQPGGVVFCLPFLEYPEPEGRAGLRRRYEPARGYLHTGTVRWSYGAMKGREVDQWQREVSIAPPAELLARAAARGFTGLLIDRRGYADDDEADAAVAELLAAVGPDAPRIDHPDGHSLFLDLRPYLARRRAERGEAGFADDARAEAEAVRVIWLHGFWSPRPPGREWEKWWVGKRAEAVFVNPSDRPRTVRVEFTFTTDIDPPFEVAISGGVWSETLSASKGSEPQVRTFVVPPGRHHVHFRCRPPPELVPTDHLDRLVRMEKVRLKVVDDER